MSEHRLTPLLAPRSIAIVGASPREGSVQRRTMEVVTGSDFDGAVYAVNPNYDEVLGVSCAPNVDALPQPPDLAVLVVGPQRMDAIVDDAIDGGARSLVIFDSCYLEYDGTPALLDRIKDKAAESGIPVCGGNGMGFFNFERNTYVSHYQPPVKPAGGITVVAHSGSAFDGLVFSDPRYRFNLAISPGQEIGASIADYMDYALGLPSTRAIALFVEAIRDAEGFVQALEEARERDVPVVAVKLGRTQRSAALAKTHTGALVGDHRAFAAVLERHGAVGVDTADELLAAAALLAQPQRAQSGGFSAMIDSGGLRESLIDRAEERGVPLSAFSPATTAYLRNLLPSYLEPENPLDYGVPLTVDRRALANQVWDQLFSDPGTAIGGFQFEVFDHFCYSPALIDAAEEIAARATKPFFVFSSFHCMQNTTVASRFADQGLLFLNGEDNVLAAVGAMLRRRDLLNRSATRTLPLEASLIHRWRKRLRSGAPLDELEALNMISEFGMRCVPTRKVNGCDGAISAANELGYPVVLKTAEPGIHHKSDRGGVHLDLGNCEAVAKAYEKLSTRLGPAVVVAPMIEDGTELAFGAIVDPQFGPLVMVSMGGVLVEVLSDAAVALAPVDEDEALRLLNELKGRQLLDGVRGRPATDLAAIAQSLSGFSRLIVALADEIDSMDVNPLIVGPAGAIAVDALVINKAHPELIGDSDE